MSSDYGGNNKFIQMETERITTRATLEGLHRVTNL